MIIGLTGFSGAGKSTTAEIFKNHGFYHLDCDALVHHRVYGEPAVLRALASRFGKDIIQDGCLNRPVLRSKTMGNSEALADLNKIMMPFIMSAIEKVIESHRDQPLVLDAPLLFESGLNKRCDFIVSVVAEPTFAAQRIIERDGLQPEEAQKRLASQHPADFYAERSDYTIINNGDLTALERQVEKIIREFYEKND
jgi:dephospho-CoA kinase